MAFSKRLYFLDPTSYLTPFTNSSLAFHTKSHFDFKRSLNKCRFGDFAGLVFSEKFLDHRELPDYIKTTTDTGLMPVFHIPAHSFLKRQSLLCKLSENSSIGLNISFTDSHELPLDHIQSFPKNFCLFTFILIKQSVLGQLPPWALKKYGESTALIKDS